MARTSQSIATYNEFIARYPDRAATPQAVGEVWQLYHAENRLSGYLDFIRRYPQTPHAVVAKYHAQQLAFEYAADFDTVTDYDAFLEAFPDAPQLEAVRLKAAARAKADEEVIYEAEKKQRQTAEFERWVVQRAHDLAAQYISLKEVVGAAMPDPLDVQALVTEGKLPAGTTQVDDVLRRNLGLRMERIYYTLKLFQPYRVDTEVLALIREEKRHDEIVTKLSEINATLVQNNTKLIDTLKQEFGQTREVLLQGFEAVLKEQRATRQALEVSFQRLEASMNQLHTDLVTIHEKLVDIHRTAQDIGANIRRANQYLARLDQGLSNVTQSLQSINRDMNVGFQVSADLTRNLTQEVTTGFGRQLAVSQQILVVNREHLDTSRNILAVNKDQLTVSQDILHTSRRHLDVSAQNLAVNTEHLSVGRANLAVNRSQLEVAQVNLQTTQRLVEVAESHRDISKEHLGTAKSHLQIGQRQLQTAQDNLTTSRQILSTNREQLDQEKQQVVLQMRGVQASEAGFAALGSAMHAGYTPLAQTTWNTPSEVQQTNLAMLARVQQVAAARQGDSQRQGQPSGLGYFFDLGMDKALQKSCPECPPEAQSALSMTVGALLSGKNIDQQQLTQLGTSAALKTLCPECPPELAPLVTNVAGSLMKGEELDSRSIYRDTCAVGGTVAATAYGGPAAGMAVSQTGLAGRMCDVLFADSKHSLFNTVKRIAPGADHIAVTQELARARNPQDALAAASKFVDVTGTTAKVIKRTECCKIKWF